MILILIGAAVISSFVGELHDALGILGAIFIGISIGIITEGKSKSSSCPVKINRKYRSKST